MRVVYTFRQSEPVQNFVHSLREGFGGVRHSLVPLPGGCMRAMTTFETDDWERHARSIKELPESDQPLVVGTSFDIVGGVACLSVRDVPGSRALTRALVEMDLESLIGTHGEVRLGIGTVSETANQDALEHAANRELGRLGTQPFRLGGIAVSELLRDGTLAELPASRIRA